MLSPTSLSVSEIDQFFERGFIGPFRAFAEDEMENVRAVIESQVLPIPSLNCSYPTQVRHLDSETIFRLCSSPSILDRMESLYGPDLLLWSSAIFDKAPSQSGVVENFPWHQDWYNWNLQPMLGISAWLAITPATIENGCMEFIPGSNKETIPWLRDTNPSNNYRFPRSSDPSFFDESKAVPVPMKAGEFYLFNERSLHHSKPNRSNDHRIGIGIRVTAPLVRIRESWPSIMLRGKECLGRNRIVDPPRREPRETWKEKLVAGGVFRFDRPIPGLGWNLPEFDGTRHFAWTFGTTSWIDLLPDPGLTINQLECAVLHAISQEALDTVQIEVNDKPVEISYHSGCGVTLLRACLPNPIPAGEPVRIGITVEGARRPCDLTPDSTDNRPLGLALSEISLS